MFLRIFYSILLIGIVNKMCHAEPLLDCSTFFDQHEFPGVVRVVLNSDEIRKIGYIMLDVSTSSNPVYEVLESCEEGAKVVYDSINDTTYWQIHREIQEQKKEILIDFWSLENNCMLIAEIKSQIEKVLFPNSIQPTLYVDLTKKNSTIRKAVKRLENGDFLLVDDCIADDGDYADLTKIIYIAYETVGGVKEAVKINFTPETEFCQSIIGITIKILDSQRSKHSTIKAVTDRPDPTVPPSTINEGTHMKYKNRKFHLVNGCKTNMSIELGTAAELEDILNKITDPVIERVNAILGGMKN